MIIDGKPVDLFEFVSTYIYSPHYSNSKEVYTFVLECLSFCLQTLSYDTKLNMHSQSDGVLMRYTKFYEETNLCFLYKNLSLFMIFLITFKAIDSPYTDRFPSSAQSGYVIGWYYLISMCHVISRLHSRFRFFLVPNSILFVMSFWMLSFLSYWLTNHGDFKKNSYEFFYLSHNINIW